MRKISFHGGHTEELCDHASGTKAGMIKAYLQARFTHVGITEHLPPDEDRFLYPDELEKGHNARFLTERFARFMDDERPRLKRDYGDSAHLFFGFETEFYGPRPLDRIEEAIQRYEPEVVVASVHHVDDLPIDFDQQGYERAAARAGSLDNLYCRYYDQQYELIKLLSDYCSEFPIVVGHFDLVKIYSPDHQPSAGVWSSVKRNIEAAVKAGLVFEVNSRAFKKGLREPYPSPRILETIRESGGSITLGDDSHGPDQVGLHYPETQQFLDGVFEFVVAFERCKDGFCTVELPLA